MWENKGGEYFFIKSLSLLNADFFEVGTERVNDGWEKRTSPPS